MNNNKIFYAAGLIVFMLLAIGMLAFLGVSYVGAGAGTHESRIPATDELILQALETGQIDTDTANALGRHIDSTQPDGGIARAICRQISK